MCAIDEKKSPDIRHRWVYYARMNIPTSQQLSDMLYDVPVVKVAQLAGVSTKSIYRYRWQSVRPTLANLEAVLDALNTLKGGRRG